MATRTITIEDNELLDTPSFDSSSINTALVNRIRTDSPTFKGEYESETTRFLTDLLSEYGGMLNYKLLGAVQNLYMPTAYSASAIYALGDTLGTDIKGNRPATIVVRLKRNTLLDEAIEIPANSSWEINGLKFFNAKPISFPISGQLVSAELTQGELLTYTTSASGRAYEKMYFGADFKVDSNSISVNVAGAPWTVINTSFTNYQINLLNDESLGNVVQMRTTAEGECFIKFGSGRFGNVPPAGSTVVITYNSNEGENGNFSQPNAKVELKTIIYGSNGDRLQVESLSNTSCAGGTPRTSLEAIKMASPGNFAANDRCVRRQDYESRLMTEGGYVDVRVWGEYEEAQRLGYADNSMMNRVFYTGLKTITNPTVIEFKAEAGTTQEGIFPTDAHQYNTRVDTSTMIKGSFVFETDETGTTPYAFRDVDGGYYLFSDQVSYSQLNDVEDYNLTTGIFTESIAGNITDAGTTTSSGNWLGAYKDPVIDESKSPSSTMPVQVVLKVKGADKLNIAGIRFLLNNIASADGRAAPKLFALYAYKGGDLPDGYTIPASLMQMSDWLNLTQIKELGDTGANAYTEWTPTSVSLPDPYDYHNNPEDYRVYVIEFYGRHGNAPYVGLQKVQVLNRANSSYINYDVERYPKQGIITGPDIGWVHINSPQEFTTNTSITMTYREGKISQRDLYADQDIIEKYNHFTTYIQFKQPVANSVNINLSVQSNNLIPAEQLRANIENELRKLFMLEYGYLGRSLYLSQIYHLVMDIEGVQYCKVNEPYDDVLIQLNEFNVLNDLTIDITTTTKA